MRVFGILAILLILVAGLFLYHRSDMFFGSEPQGPVETADPSRAETAPAKNEGENAAKETEQAAISAAKVIEKNLDDTSDADG